MAEKENVEETEKTEKSKAKNNGLLVTCLVIVLMSACAVGGWLIGSANIAINHKCNCTKTEKSSSTNEVEKTTTKETTEETTNETQTTENQKDCEPQTVVEKEKPRCYGTYTVAGTQGNEKWILKEDGTWKVEGQEKFGVFTIYENTITFIERKHITGPRDDDPVYESPNTYLISDDCSRIRFTDPGVHEAAGLDKVN